MQPEDSPSPPPAAADGRPPLRARAIRLSEEQREELDMIRETARAAVRRESLRGVAARISVSPTGLQGFLDGAVPYGRTMDHLRAWYASYATHTPLPPTALADFVAMLTRAIPSRLQATACEEVLATLERVHERAGVDVPAWLPRVRERLQGPHEDPAPRAKKTAAPPLSEGGAA